MKAGNRTKQRILEAGVILWPEVTLSNVARAVEMSHGAVLYHFPKGVLRDHIADYAVQVGESRVIVQLIAERHPAVSRMSAGERNAHFASV